MATCTQKIPRGGDISVTGRQVVKEAEETAVEIGTSETIVLGPVRVRDFSRKQFHYYNGGSYSHTVKVYHAPQTNMPASFPDSAWQEIYSVAVGSGTWSDPLVFVNDYEWLIFVASSGTLDTGAGNCYFKASRGMGK